MVRQCQVCKKLDHSSPDVSFHKFPADSERRKIWVSLLGWQDQPSMKHLYVCSNHFDPTDIITKQNGWKYIEPDANPLPSHSAFQFTSDSSDSTVFSTPPKKQRTQDICIDDSIASPVTISPSSERKHEVTPTEAGIIKEVDAPEIPSSSSSTATASETKDENFSENRIKIGSAKREIIADKHTSTQVKLKTSFS